MRIRMLIALSVSWLLSWSSCGGAESAGAMDEGGVDIDSNRGAPDSELPLLTFVRTVDFSRSDVGGAVAFANGWSFLYVLDDGHFVVRQPEPNTSHALTRVRAGQLNDRQLEELLAIVGDPASVSNVSGDYPSSAHDAYPEILTVRGAPPIVCRALCMYPEAAPADIVQGVNAWMETKALELSSAVQDQGFWVAAHDFSDRYTLAQTDALGPYEAPEGFNFPAAVLTSEELLHPGPFQGLRVPRENAAPLRILIEDHLRSLKDQAGAVTFKEIYVAHDGKPYVMHFRDSLFEAENDRGELQPEKIQLIF